MYQTLPWNHRGWHCGGDGRNTKSHVLATYQYAVELFAYLCKQYRLNPLVDGVIISHSEGCKRGIASNHGDVEHIWNRFGLTMSQFRKDIKAAMDSGTGSSADASSYTKIMGKAAATTEQMQEYIKKKNPKVA